jgi:hypothetical protein
VPLQVHSAVVQFALFVATATARFREVILAFCTIFSKKASRCMQHEISLPFIRLYVCRTKANLQGNADGMTCCKPPGFCSGYFRLEFWPRHRLFIHVNDHDRDFFFIFQFSRHGNFPITFNGIHFCSLCGFFK